MMGPLALAAMTAFPTDLGHVLAVAADRLATFTTDVGHVLAVFADGGASLASDLGHVLAVTAYRFAAFASDPRHMAAILAYGLTTFTPSLAGLLGRKFVRPALDVGCFSPLACDLALPLRIHRGEAAPRLFGHDALLVPGFRRGKRGASSSRLVQGFPTSSAPSDCNAEHVRYVGEREFRFVLRTRVDYFVPHDARSAEPSSCNDRGEPLGVRCSVSRNEQQHAGRSSSAEPELEDRKGKRASEGRLVAPRGRR
jgi:hypothetical protein